MAPGFTPPFLFRSTPPEKFFYPPPFPFFFFLPSDRHLPIGKSSLSPPPTASAVPPLEPSSSAHRLSFNVIPPKPAKVFSLASGRVFSKGTTFSPVCGNIFPFFFPPLCESQKRAPRPVSLGWGTFLEGVTSPFFFCPIILRMVQLLTLPSVPQKKLFFFSKTTAGPLPLLFFFPTSIVLAQVPPFFWGRFPSLKRLGPFPGWGNRLI